MSSAPATVTILTDILDRLSGIGAVRERVADLSGQLADMRRVMVEQQKDIAGLQGQLRALIQMQSAQLPPPKSSK